MSESKGEFLEALLAAEGRPFRPLENVILIDEFADSRNGWYSHRIDRQTVDDGRVGKGEPVRYDIDWGTVQRSTMTSHRWGSHGAQSGHYSLKVATKPESGTLARAIKRLTMPYHGGEWYSTLRFEAFFTYHEEPRGTTMHTERRPERPDLTGESTVRGFVFALDLHDKQHRWWPGIRYANYDEDGERRATWQYNDGRIDPLMDDYVDIPDGGQDLCWNSPNDSVPWKPNWHYLRIDVDASEYGYLELQCNDNVLDLRNLDVEPRDPEHDDDQRISAWPDIDGLLNPIMSIQTNANARSFLFVDSIALSAEPES
jgi:hypothetical protein